MKSVCEFIENKSFESKLRKIYSEKTCDILLGWIECTLGYVFKCTDDQNIFELGLVETDIKGIKYVDEYFTFNDILIRVMEEMRENLYSLDNDEETKEIVKKHYNILNEALQSKVS